MKTLLVAALLLAAPASASPKTERAAILTVVADMEAAWNRGDFRGYMAGFKNPDVVFVSGGKFQSGWQGTLDHYVRDYGGSAERRGKLHFYNMKVDLLGPDAAMLPALLGSTVLTCAAAVDAANAATRIMLAVLPIIARPLVCSKAHDSRACAFPAMNENLR